LVVNGFGVLRPVVADGRSDDRQLFAGGAIPVHVPPGNQGELGGGEHSPGRHEFVLRSSPRRRRLVIAVFTGLGGDQHHHIGHAVLDRGGRLGDHADPECKSLPCRANPQVVDQSGGQRSRTDPVDVVEL
jgi:hypothetical protein